MKKQLLFIIVSLLTGSLFVTQSVYGQCADHYLNETFDVAVETVVYSDVYGLEMDVYQPSGDGLLTPRPVVIFAHGGGFTSGSKNTYSAEAFCNAFAKRGYVAASINYALAENALLLSDSIYMIGVVMQAVSDGKAAIRYFRKDAATDNKYEVDTNQIFFGGSSAGGILAMHLAYLDDMAEVPEHMVSIIDERGGLDGNSGNEGYSSAIHGVFNLAGGINSLSFIDADEVPLISCHGDADGTVPFDCNDAYWNAPLLGAIDLVDLCGSSVIHPIFEENGIINELHVYEGEDHTPWSGGANREEMMSRVIDEVSNFLYKNVLSCNWATGLEENALQQALRILPNPATNYMDISLTNTGEAKIKEIELFNMQGQLVQKLVVSNKSQTRLDRDGLETGMYLLSVLLESGQRVQRKIMWQ